MLFSNLLKKSKLLNKIILIVTYDGGLGNGTWWIFQVATERECSSAA